MQTLDYASAPLRRQLGLTGAVMLGLGSILGTGVFVGLPMATALAGPWVLLAIVLAGGLAFCNAMSSAQLAAAHPVAGGTYEYGYRLLSPAWGFTAGWTFLLAKSASAATAALAIAGEAAFYIRIRQMREPDFDGSDIWMSVSVLILVLSIAITMVVGAAALAGIRRSSQMNVAIVTITLVGLGVFVVLAGRDAIALYNAPMMNLVPGGPNARALQWSPRAQPITPHSVLFATAMTFVAFTGYGRLATLGEEVINPRRTIPLAILIALAMAAGIYLSVGALLWQWWRWGLLDSRSSLVDIAQNQLAWIVGIAFVTALLGVLLNLILGLSRVWLAMGRRGDMPRFLAHVSERSGTPVPATLVSGGMIAALVLVGDVRLTWSFSAFSVLVYYAITNAACLRLPPADRRYPRSLAWVGLASCAGLAWFVEVKVWAVGVGLIGVGLAWHRLRTGHRVAVKVQ